MYTTELDELELHISIELFCFSKRETVIHNIDRVIWSTSSDTIKSNNKISNNKIK